MTRFSPKFRTYSEWKAAHNYKNEYTERIQREHKSYPKANLSQLRGHHGKRKPLSKLKPKKERKKSKKMQIVVSGNVVTDSRSHTAKNVYSEFYIRSTRDKEKIAEQINDYLNAKGLMMFPDPDSDSDKTITINFREELYGNKGKVISQSKAYNDLYDKINSELHPAGPKNRPGVSHHGDRTKEYERRKEMRRIQREEKKKRYDNNEW